MRRWILGLVVVLAGCQSGASPDGGAAATGTPEPRATGSGPSAGAPAESSEPGGQSGGAMIKLTIGEQTWEFDGALCAYQNAPAGEAGSEWNVSKKQGDLQVYVSVDSYGPSVQLSDVVNYGSLQWAAEGDAVSIAVNGNNITAEGTFTDETGASPDTQGSLTATCGSWVGS